MTKKVYTDYIQDIIDAISDIESFVKEMPFEEFAEDKKTINATIRSLEVIGEAVKNIPDPLRKNYSDIPWQRMAGMRDKLIHEYSGIDLEIIWQTIQNDLPIVKPLIEKMKDGFVW